MYTSLGRWHDPVATAHTPLHPPANHRRLVELPIELEIFGACMTKPCLLRPSVASATPAVAPTFCHVPTLMRRGRLPASGQRQSSEKLMENKVVDTKTP
jgi:hypothetical protein